MTKINPYLTFNGNCEEAFNFYKSVFGGEFNYIGRFSDMPAEYGSDPGDSNKVMHMSLPLSEGTMLMGSDNPTSQESSMVAGTNITLAIAPESEADARRIFDALSSGGHIAMPMDKTFWGSLFGMLTDKYGFHWMVDYELPKEQA